VAESAVRSVRERCLDASFTRPALRDCHLLFSRPSFAVARGSLICLGVGVERARAVDPWRGRYSVKGAELTYEGLARARVRCFVRRRVSRLNPRRNPRSKNNNPAGVFPLCPAGCRQVETSR